MPKASQVVNAYALVIGISKYKDPGIKMLNFTSADAEAIFKLLTDPERVGIKQDNIKILLDENATLFNIRDAISDWLYRNADEDSTFVIYFSGHGGREEDRRGFEKDRVAKYIIPYDSIYRNLFASALSFRDFNEYLSLIKSKKLVIFMDCCYSGDVCHGKAKDLTVTEDPFEKLAGGEGRVVIAASKYDQLSYEDKEVGHGIFTHHLLEALSGEADENKDGYVTVTEAYNYLSKNVPRTAKRLAGGIQEPVLKIESLTKDFTLAINRRMIETKEKQKRLFDLFQDDQLTAKQYDYACRLIKSSPDALSMNDKKVLKILNSFFSGEISLSTLKDSLGEEAVDRKRILELCSQAQELFKNRKYEQAIAKWRELLKISPKNEEATEGIRKSEEVLEKIKTLILSAESLFSEKKYSEAIDVWIEVLVLDPENEAAIKGKKDAEKKINRDMIFSLNSHAQRLFKEKKYDEAILKWGEVLKLELNNSDAIEGIKRTEEILSRIKTSNHTAETKFSARRYSEAIDSWEEVLRLDPQNEIAIRGKKNAETELKNLILKLSSDTQKSFDEGNYDGAISKWKEVLKLEPENKIAKEGIIKAEEKKKRLMELKCPKCSAEIRKKDKFCGKCGTSLK